MPSSKTALSWYGAPYDTDEIDEQQIVITLSRIATGALCG